MTRPPQQSTPLAARARRAVVIGIALAAATVGAWLLVFPWDWSVVESEHPDVYASPLKAWQWGVMAIVLAGLGGVCGGLGHRALSLLAVATPAFTLYCYQSAAATMVGANFWVVGAIGVFPVLYGGIAVMAVLAYLWRRNRQRPPTE